MTTDTTTMSDAKLHWLRADRLETPLEYQRPLATSKVLGIANEFDPNAIGVLYVSRRADGMLVIIDGQHRHAAFLSMGYGDQKMPCFVYEGLTLAEEAAIWYKANQVRTKPRSVDLFRASLVAQDPEAVAIQKVMTNLGMDIISGPGPNRVACIVSIRNVFKNAGPEKLSDALTILRNAWGADTTSFNGDVLLAVGAILARYSKVDHRRIEKVLAKYVPARLVSRARLLKVELGTVGRDIASTIADITVRDYNARLLEERRLAPWEDRGSQSYWWSDLRPDTTRRQQRKAS